MTTVMTTMMTVKVEEDTGMVARARAVDSGPVRASSMAMAIVEVGVVTL